MQIAADRLRRLAATILEAAGSAAAEADAVASRLVGANLAGHDSHGVIRVPQYVDQVRAGQIVPNRSALVVSETDAVTVLDGQGGYGQIVGAQSVQAAIDKARGHGIALSALRRSAHLGRLGDWAEMAAAAGMASIHFVNATGIPLRVVPHAGRDGRGTTNPLAMGIPVADGEPVVLDFATSAVAEGKVRVARNKGVSIPPDCLLDADGRPTTDPNALYAEPPGNLVPFGGAVTGHKGGALWLMVDLLAGAFTGGGCSRLPEGEPRFASNMLSIVIAPEAYAEAGLAAEIRRFLGFVKSSRPRAPGSEVLLPGEPERRARAARLKDGVPIDPTTWEQILAAAERQGLGRAELEALAA
ncbi:MAG TPA: malate/lactate/ureidoglycolate dehydrogenase [Geminicoccaceae bacterium]|nr:malate/lactate/ureidoglycolate dehydrogenase [Geminicoccaceae bacterium]